MLKFVKSPLVRISFGLVMLTLSILLASDMLGLVPDTRRAELESRKIIAESLAVQLSTVISDSTLHGVEETMRSMVERSTSVISAGLRRDNGGLVVELGDHSKHWTLQPGERSTTTQIQVPLFDEQGRWGAVELKFLELGKTGEAMSWRNSFLAVIVMVGVFGFFGYLLFLKRAMHELDPSAVIPERVRKALDTLAEGLLIVDQDGVIVFSNQAFARKTGLMPDNLVGRQSNSLQWEMVNKDSDSGQLPWFCLLEGQELSANTTVKLTADMKKTYTFTVNTSPICSAKGKIRGVLITFDDVTEIEEKNKELRRTLEKLKQSQREIKRQNQELHVLATRDPLTDALNRRSFFQGFEALYSEAREESEGLACIMVDIDHFKSVNDRFGHAVGDKVIKLLAKILTEISRPNDLVGRFGGEEFCVALPGTNSKACAAVAERMRLAIQEGYGAKFANAMRITSSFGVSDLSGGAATVAELVDQADKSLYVAKESGRNRVVSWSNALIDDASEEISNTPSADQQPASKQDIPEQQTPTETQASTQLMYPNDESNEQGDKSAVKFAQKTNLDGSKNELQYPLSVNSRSSGITCEPNRVLLFDRIDQAIHRSTRYKTHIAVMVIDVEEMQRVAETLGFSAAEKFAKSLVSRLKGALRSTDTVSVTEEDELLFSISRLGGNELVVLLSDLKQTDIVTTIITQRLFTATSDPIEVEGTEFYLEANAGVSLFPVDGQDSETLLNYASSAMREAKNRIGRNNFQFYSDDINRRCKQRIRLEADLHHALERGELVVFYQPKADLKTGAILSMEALLRWQHPQLGMVQPNDFIYLAEQSGLIGKISQRVIKTVCNQILTWKDAGYGTLSVAVNMSPVEFRNPELAEQIIALITETGIPTSALEIEITETVVMQNMDTAIDILTQLYEAGLRIAVDDFGTGYSSLSYLKKFPLSKVKIDRSFISDLAQGSNDAALVSAIIAMAHSLGLLVVAEGVETDEQLRFLQDLHCDEIQGYLVSKPLPSHEICELLDRSASIKRMIIDYGATFAQMTAQQGGAPAAGMFGILNEFPEASMGQLQPEVRRVAKK
ncbi:MAG: EAL domain-containing protein [Gammaproteobacteria bacterium]|nr:EAL domain-containing protein [Gammaproteobacteria bacterium]